MQCCPQSCSMKNTYFESNYKKLGLLPIFLSSPKELQLERYKPYIKILYLPAGYDLTVDFKHYQTQKASLFFINSNQHLHLEQVGTKAGHLIYYNRDFYCIQIHDTEVACDGLLFNNIYEMPLVELSAIEDLAVEHIFTQIQDEFQQKESSQEEMIRTYLKQLIIRATRIWKKQHLGSINESPAQDLEFFRNFSRLVEIHFREKHSVADYADLLGIAPKTLNHRLKRLNVAQPNEIIKDRIMLEAKRLLAHTILSAKEIAFYLGYDDPAYFNRLFSIKTGDTTSNFKKKYLSGKNIQSF